MNKNTIRFIFVLALMGGILLGLRLLISKKEIPLQVVYVSPENQTENVSVIFKIKIDFNRPVAINEVNVNLSPSTETLISFENNQQSIILTQKIPFHSSTIYTLGVKDQKNNILWQSTFTTEKLQGDPAVPFESEKFTQENYPLLEFIPYEDENFSITYSDPLTLKVKIKKENREAVEPLVLEWIKSHGIEPSTHKIEYFTPEPSPAL